LSDLTVTYAATYTLGTSTKVGYTFAGWTKDGQPFTSGTWNLDQDVNLVAVWTEWPVITFDLLGGTGTLLISKEPGSAISAPDIDPIKLGYEFDYYYETDDSIPYVFTTMPASDMTLFARWSTISY